MLLPDCSYGKHLPYAVSANGQITNNGGMLISRHTTFCINSLAHWTGLQPYTEEVSARGNYVSPLQRSRHLTFHRSGHY